MSRRHGTNIMGEPLRGAVMPLFIAQSLDDLRAVRNGAQMACDGWSDGEDEDTMRALTRRLERAYERWQKGQP